MTSCRLSTATRLLLQQIRSSPMIKVLEVERLFARMCYGVAAYTGVVLM